MDAKFTTLSQSINRAPVSSPGGRRWGAVTEMLAMMHRNRFRIPATPRGLQSVAATVETFCTKNAIPAATSNLMNLALDEVLSNIVKYAYNASKHGLIEVELVHDRGRLTAIVEDNGRPFDPLKFQRPDNAGPINERRPGELGILFVKRLVDSVLYDRSDGRNKLTLAIKVPATE